MEDNTSPLDVKIQHGFGLFLLWIGQGLKRAIECDLRSDIPLITVPLVLLIVLQILIYPKTVLRIAWDWIKTRFQ